VDQPISSLCISLGASEASKRQAAMPALVPISARLANQDSLPHAGFRTEELAAARWANVADQAPTVCAVWGGGSTLAMRSRFLGDAGRITVAGFLGRFLDASFDGVVVRVEKHFLGFVVRKCCRVRW
jgi:hypothetical protein